MLSYLHSFHAGCLADVHKHGLLSLLLTALTQKDRPITYMETHAGRGLYDLSSVESEKTQEAAAGILALEGACGSNWALDPAHPYRKALASVRKRYGPSFYPGSPLIARELLRVQDHLQLMELHPKEIGPLKRALRTRTGEPNCHCHHRDGFEGVLGVSPPSARAGLVLIDPSYEVKTDYDACVQFIRKLHKKWPEATIALWYPMLDSGYYKAMIADLDNQGDGQESGQGFDNINHRQLSFQALKSEDGHKGMIGTGLYIINCPWGLDEAFTAFESHL